MFSCGQTHTTQNAINNFIIELEHANRFFLSAVFHQFFGCVRIKLNLVLGKFELFIGTTTWISDILFLPKTKFEIKVLVYTVTQEAGILCQKNLENYSFHSQLKFYAQENEVFFFFSKNPDECGNICYIWGRIFLNFNMRKCLVFFTFC